MKIGILTFHRALNYGAVLQCFALYKTLADMGHEVEVIDYRPEAIERYRMLFRWKDFWGACGIAGKLRYMASSLALLFSKRKTARKFDGFLKERIVCSRIVREPKDMPCGYDIIIFGSDQIWNPDICEGLDKIYYGQFRKGSTKFIGYAASLGRQDLITGERSDVFEMYLKVFDRIAVREQSLRDFLKDRYNIDSTMVCDPSLLLTKEQCEQIAVKPNDEDYVLVFNLDGNPSAVPFAKRMAEQVSAKVIMMKAEANHLHRYPCEVRSELSPAEFLGYIKHARCIVTDSFHATSFSIIMEKDFYTLKKKTNNDRSKTILSVAGLEERMVDARDSVEYSSIALYAEKGSKLARYRQKSLMFIEENIKGLLQGK